MAPGRVSITLGTLLLGSVLGYVLDGCSSDPFVTPGDAGPDGSDATLDQSTTDGGRDTAADADAAPPTNFCAVSSLAKGAFACLDFDDLIDTSPLAFPGWASQVTSLYSLATLYTPALSFHDGGSPSPPNHMWLRFLSGTGGPSARQARLTHDIAATTSTVTLDFEFRVSDPPTPNEECTYASIWGVDGANGNVFGLSLDRTFAAFAVWVTDTGGPSPKALGFALSTGWHHFSMSATKGVSGSYLIRVDQDNPIAGNADFSGAIVKLVVSIGVLNKTPITNSTIEQNGFYDNVVIRTP